MSICKFDLTRSSYRCLRTVQVLLANILTKQSVDDIDANGIVERAAKKRKPYAILYQEFYWNNRAIKV